LKLSKILSRERNHSMLKIKQISITL